MLSCTGGRRKVQESEQTVALVFFGTLKWEIGGDESVSEAKRLRFATNELAEVD
jgi:hypothetical protein